MALRLKCGKVYLGVLTFCSKTPPPIFGTFCRIGRSQGVSLGLFSTGKTSSNFTLAFTAKNVHTEICWVTAEKWDLPQSNWDPKRARSRDDQTRVCSNAPTIQRGTQFCLVVFLISVEQEQNIKVGRITVPITHPFSVQANISLFRQKKSPHKMGSVLDSCPPCLIWRSGFTGLFGLEMRYQV